MKIFKRTFVKVLLAITVLAACAVLLAPTMLSGYIRGVVERQIGARVDGDVRVGGVDLGWTGPQRLRGLQVDGGSERGSLRFDAEVAQGLWTLATGSAVDVRLAGSVTSAVDADGSVGIFRLIRSTTPATTETAKPVSSSQQASASGLLGGRRVTVELTGVDLKATSNGAPLYAIEGLTGLVRLSESSDVAGSGTKAPVLDATAKLTAKTLVHAPNGVSQGAADVSCDLRVPRAADGAFDALRLTGNVSMQANNLPMPGSVGELVVDRISLRGEKSAQASMLVVDATTRVAGAAPSTIAMNIAAGELFDAKGAFKPDLQALRAKVDVRALPLAAFSPYVRPVGGVAIDLAQDFGDTADLSLVKDEGKTAEVKFDTRRAKLALRGEFDNEARSFAKGTLAASISARPELLRAFGLEAQSPLVAVVEGNSLSWSIPPEGTAPIDTVRGAVTAKIAAPFVWGGLPEGALANVPVRTEQCTVSVERVGSSSAASARLQMSAKYGADGAVQLSFTGAFDPATKALTNGALDTTLELDRAVLERVTNGAVSVGARERAALRVVAPSCSWSSAAGVAGTARLAVDGALVVSGGSATPTTPFEVRDVRADLVLPVEGAQPKQGNLALTANVNGAQARVEQQFARLPRDFSDPASLGLSGVVDIRGVDPAFIAQLAPTARDAIDALGSGPLDVRVANATDAGAFTADVDLKAAALKLKSSVRATKDAVALSKTNIDTSVSRALLKVARLPESVEIDPGARVLLDVPVISMARTPQGWQPAGDLSASASCSDLVVRRAPGLAAPLTFARLDARVNYAMQTERATAKGNMSLGARGTDGSIEFDVAWQKPAEAKLFAGVEGSLAATQLDVARFEPIFGLEQDSLSGVLGGAGALSLELSERGSARAKIRGEFPKARGAFELLVEDGVGGRIARATGDLRAQVGADLAGRLAGLGADPSRRVVNPVDIAFAISECSVPFSEDRTTQALQPRIAAASFRGSGTLSPLMLEISDMGGDKSGGKSGGNSAGKDGARTTISTGALAIAMESKALSEEITLRISSQNPTETRSGSAGSLQVDAKVRGAIARTEGAQAAPVVDATVRASKFPTAALDAFAGTRGALARALGDAMDADITAVGLSKERGTCKALVSSPFATLDLPEVSIAEGFARITQAKPMTATLTLSQPVREQILAPIHQIFADVSTGAPARFTVTQLSWPIDGDKRKLDGAFTLETGDVKLVNSGLLSWILSVAQSSLGGTGATTGFDAYIEPLRATITKGRLTYRDFALRAGKTAQGTWKNSLVFTGDIDLGAVPMRVDAITTGVPLSDAGNWSSEARRLFDSIGAVSPELLKSLVVGVKLSGPLYDAQGRPAKLSSSLALPDLADVLKRDPGAVVEGIGGIIDAFRKKDKK